MNPQLAGHFIGVENINEFYGDHYLEAIAESDVGKVAERWKAAFKEGELPPKRLANLNREFFYRRERVTTERDLSRRVAAQWELAAYVLEALSYQGQPALRELLGQKLPLLAQVSRPDGSPLVWALASVGAWGDEASPLGRPVPREQAQSLAMPVERAATDRLLYQDNRRRRLQT